MNIKINGHQLTKEILRHNPTDRRRQSIYISQAVFDQLRQNSEKAGLAASMVMEELARVFNATFEKKKP